MPHAVYTDKAGFSASLHALRGLAALSVVFFHAALMNPVLEVGRLTIVMQFGAGVTLFFLLSGFSLALSTYPRVGREGWLQGYLLRRAARILPVWWFFLGVTLVYHIIEYGKVYNTGEIILNAVPVFGLIPGRHESIVWAGWTIGVEVLFYAVFPLILVVCGASLRAWGLALLISVAVSVSFADTRAELPDSYLYMSILHQCAIFVLGATCYFLCKAARERGREQAAGLLFVALSMGAFAWWTAWVYAVPWAQPGSWGTLVKGLALAGMLSAFYMLRPNALAGRVFTFLGDQSYTIYLSHPIIVHETKWLHGPIQRAVGNTELSFLAYCAVVIALTCVIAWMVTRLIEAPLYRLGVERARAIERGGRSSEPSAPVSSGQAAPPRSGHG